jgi:LAGLIDADG-like domain
MTAPSARGTGHYALLRAMSVGFGVFGSFSRRLVDAPPYREGRRNVWIIETSHRSQVDPTLRGAEARAYARGYFDAEGGVPKRTGDRLYIQFVQKDLDDLAELRKVLTEQAINCGRLHNPSAKKDPDLWRFQHFGRLAFSAS